MTANSLWPPLPLSEWADTCDTLHLWTQVVGKVRMARTPVVSHWWNVPLYVTARGLTTGLVPAGERGFSVDLDLIAHRLVVTTTDGRDDGFEHVLAMVTRSAKGLVAELSALLT